MATSENTSIDAPVSGGVSDRRSEESRLIVENLVVKYGDHTAVGGISFDVRPGEFVALLGPSGCGKTTTLRAIAGLEHLTSGRIVIDGTVVADGKLHTPPERRNTNMIFQSYGVWPHMTVFANVAYGLKRNRSLSKDDVRERVMAILSDVGLSKEANRYGTELSGGQQQRVALARALATRSKLVLYDEPLSNLDTGLRSSVRQQITEFHKAFETTSIYVTHDQAEALSMADRVLVMKDGRVEQNGTPREVYARPETEFVAGFVGVTNIYSATVKKFGDGIATVGLDDFPSIEFVMAGATRMPERAGQKGAVLFRPEAMELSLTDRPVSRANHAANHWTGMVQAAMFVGPHVECEIVAGDWTSRAVVAGDYEVRVGDRLSFQLDPKRLVWLPSISSNMAEL